ncbi:MAG: hypothetical protein RMJ57_02030 [Bacteroidia bacterium]|nr:hypothetical protein [Bacteroidia bacterium]
MVYRGGIPNTSTGGLIGSTCIAYQQDNSPTKSLSVCVQAGDTYYVHVDRAPSPDCESFSNLTISAPVTVTPPMTIINTLPYNHGAGTTCGSGDNIDERRVPVCGNPIYYNAGATGEDRMWRFTPTQSGYVHIRLQGTPSDGTSLTVYEGGSFSPCGRLVNATCKAADHGSTADLRHTICVQAGKPYFILLDTLSGGCVSFSGLSLSAPVAPPNPSIGVVAITALPYRHVADSTCRKGDKVNSFNVPNSCVGGPAGTLPDGAEDMIWVFSPSE